MSFRFLVWEHLGETTQGRDETPAEGTAGVVVAPEVMAYPGNGSVPGAIGTGHGRGGQFQGTTAVFEGVGIPHHEAPTQWWLMLPHVRIT